MLIPGRIIPFAQLACLLLAMLCAPLQASEMFAVVVNPQLQATSISRNGLRAIFSMRLRNWPEGTPVKVFVLNDTATLHIAFSKEELNIFPHQLRLGWDRLVFSGTGQAPIEVESEQELRDKVASTLGAIGYLREDMIDDSIRVLPVN